MKDKTKRLIIVTSLLTIDWFNNFESVEAIDLPISIASISLERVQTSYQSRLANQQEFLLDLRVGENDISEFIFRILLIWIMSKILNQLRHFSQS